MSIKRSFCVCFGTPDIIRACFYIQIFILGSSDRRPPAYGVRGSVQAEQGDDGEEGQVSGHPEGGAGPTQGGTQPESEGGAGGLPGLQWGAEDPSGHG